VKLRVNNLGSPSTPYSGNASAADIIGTSYPGNTSAPGNMGTLYSGSTTTPGNMGVLANTSTLHPDSPLSNVNYVDASSPYRGSTSMDNPVIFPTVACIPYPGDASTSGIPGLPAHVTQPNLSVSLNFQ
jgi:hypothetical protein